jgi:hypothetical protein
VAATGDTMASGLGLQLAGALGGSSHTGPGVSLLPVNARTSSWLPSQPYGTFVAAAPPSCVVRPAVSIADSVAPAARPSTGIGTSTACAPAGTQSSGSRSARGAMPIQPSA